MRTRDVRCDATRVRAPPRMPTFSPARRVIADRSPGFTPPPKQVAAARLDALENDNADAEGGGSDDSEYEIEEGEGANDGRVTIERASAPSLNLSPSISTPSRDSTAVPSRSRRRSFSRRSNHALRPDTHTQFTRSARTHDARRRRGEGSETEEKRRDRPDDARREAKQEGRAEFRRFARRGDVGPRAAGGAHVRHGGGSPSPRGSPPEVLLGVRVPVLLQLRAVRHALLQQEVQRRAHRDALSQVHGVNDA